MYKFVLILSYNFFTIVARVLNTKGPCAKIPLFSKNKVILDKVKQGGLFSCVTKFSHVIIKLTYNISKESQRFDHNNGGICICVKRFGIDDSEHACVVQVTCAKLN